MNALTLTLANEMKIFNVDNYTRNKQTRQLYSRSQVLYNLVDVVASVSFLIGSILFFWSSTQFPAVWLFVIGSVFFALKPVIKLSCEIIYFRQHHKHDATADE